MYVPHAADGLAQVFVTSKKTTVCIHFNRVSALEPVHTHFDLFIEPRNRKTWFNVIYTRRREQCMVDVLRAPGWIQFSDDEELRDIETKQWEECLQHFASSDEV
jgi:hypothetical protein